MPLFRRHGGREAWRLFTSAQRRHPRVFVLAFALLAALGLWRAGRLEVVTDFTDLLAPDQPSVVELRRVLARTRALSNVFVVLEGRDPTRLRTLADQLVATLSALGPHFVHSAASGVQAARTFLLPRAGLFLTEEHIDALRDQLREQERQEFRRRIGADLDDDVPAPLDEQALRAQFTARIGSLARYPDGYFQGASPSGAAIVVVVKSPVAFGDLAASRVVLEQVRHTVASAMAAAGSRGHGITVGYAGDLVTSLQEYSLVRNDAVDVGLVGVTLVVGVVLLFFRSPRALLALVATIACGCALTFGVAELVLGHLNVASAFLISIVAGNGVNFGIIWLARYAGERRAGRSANAAAEEVVPTTISAFSSPKACSAAALAKSGFN
ncbi:MAG: MMPL family transporter [Pseudomonadota bacterium]